jgi:hypothetical protein
MGDGGRNCKSNQDALPETAAARRFGRSGHSAKPRRERALSIRFRAAPGAIGRAGRQSPAVTSGRGHASPCVKVRRLTGLAGKGAGRRSITCEGRCRARLDGGRPTPARREARRRLGVRSGAIQKRFSGRSGPGARQGAVWRQRHRRRRIDMSTRDFTAPYPVRTLSLASLGALRVWWTRRRMHRIERRAARQFAHLPPHMRADIGLSAAEVGRNTCVRLHAGGAT